MFSLFIDIAQMCYKKPVDEHILPLNTNIKKEKPWSGAD